MKRIRLLLAAFAAMVGLSANAQGWTAQEPSDGDFYLYNVGTGTFLSCGSEYWGSKACIDNGGLNFTLANNGEGKYTLYTTSTFSYGNPNSAQLQSSGYVDQNVSATTWTFTLVDGLENTYTMLNAAGTYLVAPSDGTKSILLNAEAPTNEYGYWKLINKANLFPETASEENPADITCLIGDANFESTQDPMENFWTIDAKNNNLKKGTNGGLIPNNVVESWQSSNGFTLSQTITVPNGYYKLTAQTWCREYTVTGADLPYIYLNDVKKDFNLMGTETASLGTVAGFFSNGDNGNYYTTTTDVATVSAKSITLGAKGTRTNTWNVFDNFKLYYLGPIDLSTYVTELENAVAAAEATEGTIPTAAYNAIAAVVEEYNKTYEDGDAYTAAIVAINNAVSTYASSAIVNAYSSYNKVKAAVLAVDNTIDVSAADGLANDGTDANLDDAVAAVRTALKNYLKTTDKTNVSLTDALLINPSFETGDFTGWTNNNMALQTNTSFGKHGNVYCEKWQPNGTFGVSQTLSSMPSGVYQLTAKAKARGVTSAKLSVAGIERAITIADSETDYTIEFAIDDDTDITMAFEGVGTGAGSSWLVVDNFRLSLGSAGLPDVTAVEGKMNADVATTQTTAIATYNANKTVANYNAASSAIAAAQASADAYAKIPSAIEDATTLKEAHNFVTAAAATAFAEAIAAAQSGYDEGTLTDAEANNYANLGVRAVAWHDQRAEANRTAAEAYMKSADFGINLNDWSVEGESDGSDFVVPFFEYWVSDANSLGAATKTATLADLPNGLYSVQAWVRVRAKNGTTATDATGITMDVNGGGEGDFAAVDVTEGTQVSETQFSLGTFTAQGLVKDGSLTLNFNVAEGNNISWLSFKNIKYTKVRDLTEDEAAIAPTAIALFNGEEEVTEAITLDIENTTVTLTPSYTPESATEGCINWTSSDESVATVSSLGEVTAVLPGTATITATSTLAPEVSASATINVVFPETEVAEYTNDGATRYILGENLIENGTFEYPNSFYGWKSGANGNCDNANFEIVTDGDNKYLKSRQSKGATDSHSISTGWPIENGKTYIFGYKVKVGTAGNSQYHVVSMTNSIGTETAKVSSDNTATKTSWTDVNYKFTNTGNYAYVQFRARWLDNVSFDDFYLQEVTDEVGNADYALEALPKANIGGGAFQYAPETIMATGINTLVQGTSTPEQVQNVYDALQAMELNEPADGKAFNIILTYGGWDYDNKAMTYMANDRNNDGNYNIKYNAEANANYAQAFTFTKVDGNNYKLSQIDEDGNVRYITDQKTGGYGNGTASIRTTTDESKAAAYKIIATSTEGVYNIYNNVANNYIGSQDAGVYTVNSHIDFKIVEAEKANVTGSLAAGKLATRIFPFTPEAIDGIKYYSVEETHLNGNETHIVPVEVEEPVANTPYILYNTTEDPIDITQSGFGTATKDVYSAGALTGVYTDSEIAADAGNYILQTQHDVQAFYLVSGSARTATPYRAYLTAPGAGARIAISFDNETTGINGVNATEKKFDGTVYDLSGRKVAQPARGLYIVNGKKVVIK